MELERLREILDAYGAEPAHWPAAERAAAAALIARAPEARKLRDEAARLDALLDSAPAAELGIDAAKVVANVAAMSGKVRRLKPRRGAWGGQTWGGIWPSFAGLAAAAAAGFVVGWLNLAPGYGLIGNGAETANGDASGYSYTEVQPW